MVRAPPFLQLLFYRLAVEEPPPAYGSPGPDAASGETLRSEDFGPFVERQVGGDQDGASLVALVEGVAGHVAAERPPISV